MADQNEFCSPDDNNYPKWSMFSAMMWKISPNWEWLHSYGGQARLLGYKRAWVRYNRRRIIDIAKKELIPADLLGCVIFNEVGGDPPWFKRNVVLSTRQFLPWQKTPMVTSEGAIKIQLQAALSALDYKGPALDRQQQDQLTSCLETDVFNIDVVAKYLRAMILHDYPGIDTTKLTDEQFAIAGSRYNRGTARPLKDFQDSLKDKPGQPDREYTSYGRAMLRHRDEVKALLGM